MLDAGSSMYSPAPENTNADPTVSLHSNIVAVEPCPAQVIVGHSVRNLRLHTGKKKKAEFPSILLYVIFVYLRAKGNRE